MGNQQKVYPSDTEIREACRKALAEIDQLRLENQRLRDALAEIECVQSWAGQWCTNDWCCGIERVHHMGMLAKAALQQDGQ